MRHVRHLFSLLSFVLCFCGPCLLAADGDAEDYEPPPEGYEERHYSISTLVTNTTDFNQYDGYQGSSGNSTPLTEDQIADIVKTCVAPESWTRRGPARMQTTAGDLIVLQKKEVHAEIAKVLAWLHDGAAAPFRGTVVVSALKPETLKRIADGGGTLSSADLLKALDEAGADAMTEIVELRGQEGQRVVANATDRQQYIADFDVSGAVYDPQMRSVSTGLLASAEAMRLPDCTAAMVTLSVDTSQKPTMEKAQIEVDALTAAIDPNAAVDKKEPAKAAIAPFKSKLSIDLPSQAQGGLRTSLLVPRGVFVLAGTFDLSLASGKADRRAVFVRATIGNEGVPTLQGVSGLKEGETFRLYPTASLSNVIPDFPGPVFLGLPSLTGAADVGVSSAASPAASPFDASKAASVAVPVFKAQVMFNEKVRKNKIVDVKGPMVFTRLNNEDHAKLQKTFSDSVQRRAMLRIRAVALAVSPEAHRKLLLDDTASFDAAAVEALVGGVGAQLLTDSVLSMLPEQRVHIFAGQKKNVVSKYEISGDSYDPSVYSILERGYVLDFKTRMHGDEPKGEVEMRFQAIPAAAGNDRTTLEAMAVNSGANANIVVGLHAELDRLKMGIISVKGNSSIAAGKFVLAGSAKMPATTDGKADPRQVLLFLRLDAGK